MKKTRKSEFVPRIPPDRIFKSIEKLGLTEEDMLRLEQELTPIEGAPYPLGWPHYRALLEAREDVERFWYQEKAQNQALRLRELETALRENLFYELLGRKPPEPRPLGAKRPAPEIRPGEFDNDPAYQELFGKVKKIFDDAEAKGVQIRNRREDILSCSNCGAFEDVLCGEGSRRTFLSKGEETEKPFLVIDAKETTEYYEHGNRSVMEYQYVCGACGVHQSASFTSFFYDEDLYGDPK